MFRRVPENPTVGITIFLSFRPGLDGGERLLVLLSLLPSLGRPDSDVGVGSDPADGRPHAGLGGIRVPSDGCGFP